MCNHVEPSEYKVQLIGLDPKSGSSMVKSPGILSGGSRGPEFKSLHGHFSVTIEPRWSHSVTDHVILSNADGPQVCISIYG